MDNCQKISPKAMDFADAARVGTKAEVLTGLFKIVSGVPAVIDGSQMYCPFPSFNFLMALTVASFITNTAFFLYGDFKL